MEAATRWLEESPYSRSLGVQLDFLGEDEVELRLPFREENANPGKALHGGCAASLAVLGAQALARAGLGEASGPWHTAGLHVAYLAAAIDEEVVARARRLRKGRELCFVDVGVETAAGKPIARAAATVRGRFGEAPAQLAQSGGDDGASQPGPMAAVVTRTGFIASRGLAIEHMQGGRSRLLMPWHEANADEAGGVHEGAVLALLDTTGAMAAWAETGPGRYRASTPAIQAQLLAPPPRGDLVGYGRVVQRDREILWSAVEIAGVEDARVCARGTVVYRIVT